MSRRPPAPVGACPNPVEVVCPCGEVKPVRCKSRRCPSCGQLWAGDTRKLLVANLDSYGGPVKLATVTAPGREKLRHDPDGNVSWASAYWWNKQVPHHWRGYYQEAQQHVHRELGRRALVLAWVWQYQRRGVLHKHLILGVATASDRRAADRLVYWLDRLRSKHGFGFVDRGRWDYKRRRRDLREMTGQHAGRYAAKYLVQRDNETGRYAVSETVTHDDVPPRIVYVKQTLTAATGVTMRGLREWRFIVATHDPIPREATRAILAASGYDVSRIVALVDDANAPPGGP
jgi:hypothetical protein